MCFILFKGQAEEEKSVEETKQEGKNKLGDCQAR